MIANIGFKLTVTAESGASAIDFQTDSSANKNIITSVSFLNGVRGYESNSRAIAVRSVIEVKGIINKDTKSAIKQLANWSLDTNAKSEYRDVEILINEKDNFSGDNLRRYEFKKMLILSYEENFKPISNADSDNEADAGEYVLIIAQKDLSTEQNIFDS